MKRKTFPNQLEVIYEKSIHSLPISSIQIVVKMGSIQEPNDLRGVCHLIEHMCFKGTHLHPNANSIFHVSPGAEFNAYTDKMLTCYYIKCLNQNVSACIEVLSDMIFHSFFHPVDFKRERNVVVEENLLDADDLDDTLELETDSLIFPNHPYGYAIDCIKYHRPKLLSIKKVVEFYKLHYIPRNIIVSIHSSLSFETVLSKLENSYFYSKVNTPDSFPLIPPIVNKDEFSYKLIHKNDTLTTYISVGFLVCSYDSEDKFPLDIFKTVLSGGMNSYLFSILREQNGLTYHSDIETNYYKTAGSFVMYTAENYRKVITNGNKKGVLPIVMNVFSHFYKNGITLQQLKTAKQIMKENLIRDLEDVNMLAEYNAIELLHNNAIIPYHSLFQTKYNPLTIDDVNRTIRKYFTINNMNICLVGQHLPSKKIVEKYAFI